MLLFPKRYRRWTFATFAILFFMQANSNAQAVSPIDIVTERGTGSTSADVAADRAAESDELERELDQALSQHVEPKVESESTDAATTETAATSETAADEIERYESKLLSDTPSETQNDETTTPSGFPLDWFAPDKIGTSLKFVLTMSVLSLAPAILLMTTSYIRISIVLSLLRQALGATQIPSNQVTTSISIFMTLLIMWPVWSSVYYDAIVPYSASEPSVTWEEAWGAGVQPVHAFMSHQIERAGNSDDIWLFFKHLPEGTPEPERFEDVPLQVLLPAFVLSELKTAFLIGFQIYLPFLVIDIVVATVTTSMGMIMLPPTMISLPLKLLLFVMVDGWRLIAGMLMDSFAMHSI